MKQTLFSFFSWLFLQLLAWHIEPLLGLVAFVPFLFFLENSHKYKKITAYFFILSWHFVVIFWLLQMDWLRGLEAIAFNSLLTSCPIFLSLYCQEKLHSFRTVSALVSERTSASLSNLNRNHPKVIFSVLFVFFWLLMEYLQHHWFMGFPWLVLGNVFGASPAYVQWYSLTGVLGGSLWILVCNIGFKWLLESLTNSCRASSSVRGLTIVVTNISLLAVWVFVPFIYSWWAYKQPSPRKDLEIIFVQSNIDYNESDSRKISLLQESINPLLKPTTDYLVLPETFFSSPLWENQIKETVLYLKLKNLLHQYPNLKIIFGANLKRKSKQISPHQEIGIFYDLYNVAIELDSSERLKIKEKAVFVPIEEYVPKFLQFIPFKSDFLSLPTTHQHSFQHKKGSVFIGICYEMVNSFFVKEHLQKTDKAMLMLSSEAFFEGAEIGMKQYINICRLRTIESQLPLIKSSSKGYATSTDSKGNIAQKIKPSQDSLLKASLIKI
jgi:apolipoprotein N-acyltransferase